MIESYKSAVLDALAVRRRLPTPRVGAVVCGVVSVVLVAIALGVGFGSERHASSQFGESGGITKLSASFMAIAALLAGTTFVYARRQPRRGSWFWLLSGLAFCYFSLDEIWQFHESAGFWMGDREEKSPLFFRNWNDVVVILYGVGAIIVCGAFLPEILRLPRFALLVGVAGFFYVAHTAIDSVFTRSDRSVMVEESAKLFSAAFFAIAFLTSSIGIRRLNDLPGAAAD